MKAELLSEHLSPVFSGSCSVELGGDIPGANKLIDSLVSHNILAPYDDRVYSRRFYAPRVMEVLLEH